MTLNHSIRAATAAITVGLFGIAPAAAQGVENRAAKPIFEIEADGGIERGTFSTIGPFGLTTQRVIVNPDNSGNFAVLGGHALFRPRAPSPFGIDAYRLDFRHSQGSAEQADAFFSPFSSLVLVPSVDGTQAAGTGATSVNIVSHIRQERSSFEIRPSLVWESVWGGLQTVTRIGAGYSRLRQDETISIIATVNNPVGPEFETLTRGDLVTRAFGAFAAFDLRAPITRQLSLVGGLEGTLEYGRTQYEGVTFRSSFGGQTVVDGTASDRSGQVMAGVRLNGGAEWMPLPGLTVSLVGNGGWQSGMAHVAYPQMNKNSNSPVISGGPAHIGYEDRLTYGARGAIRWQF